MVIAQDRLAKSTLVFDGYVKFGIFCDSPAAINCESETTPEKNLQFKMVFSKNGMSTVFVFLNSNEAHMWYIKLLELGIPQLVEVVYPSSEQLE